MSNPYVNELKKNDYGETLPQHYNEQEQGYEPSRGDRDGLYVKDREAIRVFNELLEMGTHHDPKVAGLLEDILQLMGNQGDVQPVHDEPSYDELVQIKESVEQNLELTNDQLSTIHTFLNERFEKTLWDETLNVQVMKDMPPESLEELKKIREQQAEILERLNEPILTQQTGSNVQLAIARKEVGANSLVQLIDPIEVKEFTHLYLHLRPQGMPNYEVLQDALLTRNNGSSYQPTTRVSIYREDQSSSYRLISPFRVGGQATSIQVRNHSDIPSEIEIFLFGIRR